MRFAVGRVKHARQTYYVLKLTQKTIIFSKSAFKRRVRITRACAELSVDDGNCDFELFEGSAE